MKKAKILTVLGVLLAMGITACNNGGNKSEEPKSEEPSSVPAPTTSQGGGGGTSVAPTPQKDQTGHIWGADQDVAGDAEKGLVAYKKAECSEADGAVKLTINSSVFAYDEGSSVKNGTPEGYSKLNGNNQTWRVKFNLDKFAKGKLYLYGCMDGWSSNSSKNAFSYNGKPNIAMTVNGEALDIAALSSVVYTDFLSGSGSDYSDDGYGLIGNIVLKKGVNEISYSRLASMNTLVKDLVLVLDEQFDEEWGAAQEVAATATSVAYKKSVSNLNGAIKIEWKALDGTFAEGSSNKDGTPAGFLKLKSNNHEISYALDFNADLDGEIYQRGAMDNYASNQTRTYYSAQSGAKYGNFEMKVNGSTVYYGDRKDVTYVQLLGEGSNPDTENMSGYSEVKDCLIGPAFIKNGANTVSFKRLDSFNLAVSDFVFIGKAGSAHTNPAADAAFEGKDDISHWQKAANDEFKYNRGDHQWAADPDATDTESTCTVQGEKHYKCSVCGATKIEKLELAAHTWVSDPDAAATDTTSTCTQHGVAHMKCSVCGKKENQELPLGAHSFTEGTPANNSDGFAVTPITCSACNKVGAKMSIKSFTGNTKSDATYKHANGTTVTYKIIVSKAGNYKLEIGAYVKDNRTKTLAATPYTVKVGEGDAAVDVPVSSGSYEELGIGGGSSVNIKQFVLCPTIALAAGENVISIAQGSGGYRLTFGGDVVVVEL